MATKKSPQKPADKEEQNSVPSITARIERMVDYEGTCVRAIASANIAGIFAIHGLKVMESEKGMFVSMPQTRYEKDGKTKYSDICHPITAKARQELFHTVLSAYEQNLQVQEEPQSQAQTEECEPPVVE